MRTMAQTKRIKEARRRKAKLTTWQKLNPINWKRLWKEWHRG